MDSLLSKRGQTDVMNSIFRIEVIDATGQHWNGTGFAVGYLPTSNRVVLATAKHVLEVSEHGPAEWRVQRFDRSGRLIDDMSFLTDANSLGKVPYRLHKFVDLGVIALPPRNVHGKSIDRAEELPVPLIPIKQGVCEGTRIAWSGYPMAMETCFGFPHMCYFEGVVSAMIDRSDQRFYIVDGHVSGGVSGGPVWHWSEDRNGIEVFGVVAAYQPVGDWPGYCIMQPVNSVIGLLQSPAWKHSEENGAIVMNL